MTPPGNSQALMEVGGARLQRLVDRLIDSAFECFRQPAGGILAFRLHQARRLRHAGDLDGALEGFAQLDVTQASTSQARWAYSEWLTTVRRRFPDTGLLVYSPGTGHAAALAPYADGTVEVLAVVGMSWQPGKLISRRSLRGVKPLDGGR